MSMEPWKWSAGQTRSWLETVLRDIEATTEPRLVDSLVMTGADLCALGKEDMMHLVPARVALVVFNRLAKIKADAAHHTHGRRPCAICPSGLLVSRVAMCFLQHPGHLPCQWPLTLVWYTTRFH